MGEDLAQRGYVSFSIDYNLKANPRCEFGDEPFIAGHFFIQ